VSGSTACSALCAKFGFEVRIRAPPISISGREVNSHAEVRARGGTRDSVSTIAGQPGTMHTARPILEWTCTSRRLEHLPRYGS
jgi:hypothetical protein